MAVRWPYLQSLGKVTLVAEDTGYFADDDLALTRTFVRDLARSRPAYGHFLYEYMKMASLNSGVQWTLIMFRKGAFNPIHGYYVSSSKLAWDHVDELMRT